MPDPDGTTGVLARLNDGWWEDPQPSALSFLGGTTDELDSQWPRAGTVRGDVAYRRPSPSPRGARQPWPTPTARLGDERRGMPSPRLAQARMAEGRRNLDDAVVLWPTPTASDEKGSNKIGQRRRQLSEAVLKYPVWPTPTTQDAKCDGSASQQQRNMKPLNALVVSHPEGSEEDQTPGGPPLLNAAFVELLMGFPGGWTDV